MRNEKLIALRKASGLTQKEASEAVNMDLRLYQRYESGEVSLKKATAEKVLAISKVFGVTVEELISENS